MENRPQHTLRISGSNVVGDNESFLLILEPWADEYVVQPEDDIEIVAIGDPGAGSFRVAPHEKSLIVWLEFQHPVDFQFWRNGALEDESNNPA
ncbi:hypothetical protein NG895_28430 [Aeoliella sp. ICT_H6.2]|uniref:Uncharacterized protein n=1 Tax=Aeoliella straminimaris TaxID=2954799 RepID=A0A9X2FJS6_9BACT|nr:hypothetical protein [Aeoliella straminimaris]MCO6047851.1 hypothetical protein [Aeoliella straminimaris]